VSATPPERHGPAASRGGGLGGGVAARRAVIRWALRLLRREWRQQLLILGLITVAVGATVVASAVATAAPSPIAGVLGTAQDAALLTGPTAKINAEITGLESRYGRVDVIENKNVQIPGTRNTFELRAQDPHGPFGGPMLSLVSGHYPATTDQITVTSGVAADFRLSIGGYWTVAGKTWKVTGIVQNPQSLLEEFALVIPDQVTTPDNVTVLFDAPGQATSSIEASTGLKVTTAQTLAKSNVINPETISVAAAVLGMLLIALVSIGGFTVLAQRRLRAIGMLAAQGATQRHIRLVVRANGTATGIVGAVAGFVLGFLAWLAYRPQAEQSAHHLMGVLQLQWTVIGISMALAIIATYFAASRPAKAIARTPIVAALAGRPPAPKKTRHLALPVGIGFLAGAVLLLGAAGAAGPATTSEGGSQYAQLELLFGLLALGVAIVVLASACLPILVAIGRWSPISVRLAMQDLARYRARSGPALAAICLSTLIAAIICVVGAARFGNALDDVGPNLTSSQLIVYPSLATAPGATGNKAALLGRGKKSGEPSAPLTMARARQVAGEIAVSLGTTSMVTLESTSACLIHAAAGSTFSGALYVATPQLLSAFGITQSQVNSGADILTSRAGLSTIGRMQLTRTPPCTSSSNDFPCPPRSCVANPSIQEVSQLPSGTSASNTVITEHAITRLGLQGSITTAGWLITVPNGLNAAQVTRARQLAAGASGMSVETRNSFPSLAQIVDTATIFGIVLVLGILGMSVGLVRSEAARDLRTLTAVGAAPTTRRTITAATAGSLGFIGGVIGIVGGYLAVIVFFWKNQPDGLSSLSSIPLTNLLVILVGMPLAAVVIGWLVAGREPVGMSRQPLE
jgi:putative ABC transport system permease protein